MEGKRVEAFSDGVFAVAITLLALELKVPEDGGTLVHRMLAIWPSYLAYVVSFLTIGIMWLNHHTMFTHIVRVNRALLLLNLLLLMVVAVVPFPTALVGEELGAHLRGDDAKTIMATYGLVMILMSIFFSAMWWYVVLHPQMLDEGLPSRSIRRSVPRFGFGLFGYVLATVIALVSPLTALVLFGLLALYYAFEHLPTARKLDPDAGAATG